MACKRIDKKWAVRVGKYVYINKPNMTWPELEEQLGATRNTIKKWGRIYKEGEESGIGGKQSIINYIKEVEIKVRTANKGKKMRKKSIGNTRMSLWEPEFRYSELWNSLLYRAVPKCAAKGDRVMSRGI